MIYYPCLSAIQLNIWNPKIVTRYVEPFPPGLPLVSTDTGIIDLLRIRGAAPGSVLGATPAASTASAAAAPSGRHRRGARRRSGRHIRIRPRGRRPGGRVQRRTAGGRRDPVEQAVIAPGFCGCIPSSDHRAQDKWRRRGAHHSRRASLRDPFSARLSASASSVRGQCCACGPASASIAAHSASAHALQRRRRASVQATHQRRQVLLLTL